ncbi:MAG: response regulator, partial [Burkholderiaceae bacterium]|nr:response regulator [Burkholderiaceae bacterium]
MARVADWIYRRTPRAAPGRGCSFRAWPDPSDAPEGRQTAVNPRALIAEDEPLLARALRRELARLWPELQVIGMPEDGPAAAEIALRELPEVIFLDVQMPGATGLDVAAEVADEWPEGR